MAVHTPNDIEKILEDDEENNGSIMSVPMPKKQAVVTS